MSSLCPDAVAGAFPVLFLSASSELPVLWVSQSMATDITVVDCGSNTHYWPSWFIVPWVVKQIMLVWPKKYAASIFDAPAL
jgi:hypothetical protein